MTVEIRTHDLGEITGILQYRSKERLNDVLEELIESANETLNPGKRYEIRRSLPFSYGRLQAIRWQHTPDMENEEKWESPVNPRFDIEIGATVYTRGISE